MVLWSNLGKDCEVALRKCGHEKNGRSAGLSEESAGEASNLMWRPVQRGNRDATTSACVGWDLDNIENQSAFCKETWRSPHWHGCLLKRLYHYQDNRPDHEDRGYFIDNTIEFLAPQISVGGEILDAAGKKTVDTRQHHHQQKLAVQPAR